MNAPVALFPALLGPDWSGLSEPVRQMHGDSGCLRACGEAEIEGAMNLPARILRRMLALPAPGTRRPVEFTVERNGMREIWTRDFEGARMRSVLDRAGDLLRERLGPMTFRFRLRRSVEAIEWELRSTRFLGLPLPRWMSGHVFSQSGSQHGRYAFKVDVRMPLAGQLVSYRGWLEVVSD
jgi:hypothetical protein